MFMQKTQRNCPQITYQIVFPYVLLTTDFSIGSIEKYEDRENLQESI